MANRTDVEKVNVDAVRSEIRQVLINQKANACPIAVRLAWHAAGTFDKRDGSGGCNGATMRFAPESSDPANAGLSIVRDLLLPVKKRHPELTYADLWAVAGCAAIEFLGGPRVEVFLGRSDDADGRRCPANGRLPDAAQGAAHIRDVFHRMGFDDREIVALSGAHTLGRCHQVRSGFDGPWTRNPLKFDNTFFRNLIHMEWRPRQWDGPLQYEDVLTGELMMLPTDMALKTDPSFRVHAERYAADEAAFFHEFAGAFAKLIALGVPAPLKRDLSSAQRAGVELREAAMHGSLSVVQKHARDADVDEPEANSGRTALHKAAFWGHEKTVEYIVATLHANVNAQDVMGDTPLHDAVRFGHTAVVRILLANKANPTLRNRDGKDAAAVAKDYDKPDILALLKSKL